MRRKSIFVIILIVVLALIFSINLNKTKDNDNTEKENNEIVNKGPSIKVDNINIAYKNLDKKFLIHVLDENHTSTSVIIRGDENLLSKLDKNSVEAYINLKNYKESGEYTIKVLASGDVKDLEYIPVLKNVKVIIREK